jgi:hypothetical protein
MGEIASAGFGRGKVDEQVCWITPLLLLAALAPLLMNIQPSGGMRARKMFGKGFVYCGVSRPQKPQVTMNASGANTVALCCSVKSPPVQAEVSGWLLEGPLT